MLAQTLVEYGALSSIGSELMHAWQRVELFVESINPRYFLILAIVILVLMIATRRRSY